MRASIVVGLLLVMVTAAAAQETLPGDEPGPDVSAEPVASEVPSEESELPLTAPPDTADPVAAEDEIAVTPSTGVNSELYGALPALPLPDVAPGVLAFGSSFRIIAGTFRAESSGRANDGADNEVTSVGLELDSRYFRSLETTSLGYSVIAELADAFTRSPGDLYTNTLNVVLAPELRVYLGKGPYFAFGSADFNLGLTSIQRDGGEDSNGPGNLGGAVGFGAGRVLSVDPVIRLKRLEESLQAARLLKGPIPAELGTDLIRTWYALRNDFGNYRTLAYTMKHLDGAGLIGNPDLRATYHAQNVLADPFIVDRRAGWDARAGLGVAQPFVAYDNQDEVDPFYSLVASGQWERPLGTDRQLSVRGKLLVDLGDSDEQPRVYTLRGFAGYTQVFYNDTYDPLGALNLSAEAGASGLRMPDAPQVSEPELGLDVVGRVAWSRALNRGSLATASGTFNLRNDGGFSFLLEVGVTWGIASGYFTAYPGVAAATSGN